MNWSSDLIELLILEMPRPKKRKDGFLDIVEVQYHENSITRIYAYFLDSDKHSGVAYLFLNSLLNLIKLKTHKELKFENHFCQLEKQTDKGNRIDMVIKTGNETYLEEDYAIIIENKIFSPVHNNLQDYWSSVKVEDVRKVGVLLTPGKLEIPIASQKEFVNITHAEWMNQIITMGLPHGLDSNMYVYLNDFINTMNSLMATTDHMNEDAQFFFEHTSKVLRAMKTYDAARNHVITQLRVLSEKLQLGIYGNSNGWRHIWDYKSLVYYVFGFENVLKANPSITIYLEVYKDGIPRYEELKKLLNDAGHYKRLFDDQKHNQSWAHLAFREYDLTKADLENLADFLYQKIKEDFEGAYNLIMKTLH